LPARFGEPWTAYRRNVRAWWPRWRPFIGGQPSCVYIAGSCDVCSGVGRWLSQRRPSGLELCAAESHPGRVLRRMTYEGPDGYAAEGVEAFARCLEHINLGYAWLGMFMRLPVICPALQVIVDASGGGPRRLPPLGQGA
jgi:hypothetical protein